MSILMFQILVLQVYVAHSGYKCASARVRFGVEIANYVWAVGPGLEVFIMGAKNGATIAYSTLKVPCSALRVLNRMHE